MGIIILTIITLVFLAGAIVPLLRDDEACTPEDNTNKEDK